MAKRTKRNYVNNADLYEALKEYQAKCREAQESGNEKPVVTKYIGECIWQIASRFASKPQYSAYPYREDMVMDGVENCLLYMHNFNPEKTQNPFAYFTQIIKFAFWRRIAKEKKQMYVRYKSSQTMLSMGGTFEGDDMDLHLSTDVSYINDFIQDYEDKMFKDKKIKDSSEDDV